MLLTKGSEKTHNTPLLKINMKKPLRHAKKVYNLVQFFFSLNKSHLLFPYCQRVSRLFLEWDNSFYLCFPKGLDDVRKQCPLCFGQAEIVWWIFIMGKDNFLWIWVQSFGLNEPLKAHCKYSFLIIMRNLLLRSSHAFFPPQVSSCCPLNAKSTSSHHLQRFTTHLPWCFCTLCLLLVGHLPCI